MSLVDKVNDLYHAAVDYLGEFRLGRKSVIPITLSTLMLYAGLSLASPKKTFAQTQSIVYVDDSNTSGIEDGTIEHPYNTISEGVSNAQPGNIVHVVEGTYIGEQLSLSDINLEGEGPSKTIITDSNISAILNMTYITDITNFKIINSTIKVGYNTNIKNNYIIGSTFSILPLTFTDTNPVISNNLVMSSPISGIYCLGVEAEIVNNTIVENTEFGIIAHVSNPIIKNNIIVNNSGGIVALSDSATTSFPVISYNDVYNNAVNYVDCSPGTGDISADPLFVDSLNDFHLSQGSPCVDAGDPLILDIDSTRSDMGMYGGPGSWVETVLPTLNSINITDHLKQANPTFQKIHDIVLTNLPYVDHNYIDATVSLEFDNLENISKVEGVFVPAFVDIDYESRGEFVKKNGTYEIKVIVPADNETSGRINAFLEIIELILAFKGMGADLPRTQTINYALKLDEINVTLNDSSIINFDVDKLLPSFVDIVYNKLHPLENNMEIIEASPVDILVENLMTGNKLGRKHNGGVTEFFDIPNSIYSGDTEPEYIFLFGADNNIYKLLIQGTDFGTFTQTIKKFAADNVEVIHRDIPIDQNSRAVMTVSIPSEDYNMNIDNDNDGSIDDVIEPSSVIINDMIIPSSEGHPWPMYRHDPQRTGRSPFKGPETNDLEWFIRHPTYTSNTKTLLVLSSDSVLYFPVLESDEKNKLYLKALNTNKTLKWNFPFFEGKRALYGKIHDLMLLSNGTINSIISTRSPEEGIIHSFNPDGTLNWQLSSSAFADSGSIYTTGMAPDEKLYVGFNLYSSSDLNKDLYVVGQNGQPEFLLSVPFGERRPLAVDKEGRIYIPGRDSLRTVDPSGKVLWRFGFDLEDIKEPDWQWPSVSIGFDGTVYIRSLSGLYSIYPDGNLKWKFKTDPPNFFSWGPPSVDYDGVVFIRGDYNIYAINHDGSIKWSKGFERQVNPNMVVAENGIYAATSNRVFALDKAIGTVKWSTKEDDIHNIADMVISSDGKLYAVSLWGTIYAFGKSTIDIKEEKELPKTFLLYQNYPNPFNEGTTIKYDVPEASDIEVLIYNILGKPIKHLHKGKQQPGRHQISWDGTDDKNDPVSSGIYIYQINADNFTRTNKMLLLK